MWFEEKNHRQSSVHNVCCDKWILGGLTMSTWFKCSDWYVPRGLASSLCWRCRWLSLPIFQSRSGCLSSPGSVLIEIDFVSSEGSCCNRSVMSRSWLQIFCSPNGFRRLISRTLQETTRPAFTCPRDGSLARKNLHTFMSPLHVCFENLRLMHVPFRSFICLTCCVSIWWSHYFRFNRSFTPLLFYCLSPLFLHILRSAFTVWLFIICVGVYFSKNLLVFLFFSHHVGNSDEALKYAEACPSAFE